jgi:hypothetical protein
MRAFCMGLPLPVGLVAGLHRYGLPTVLAFRTRREARRACGELSLRPWLYVDRGEAIVLSPLLERPEPWLLRPGQLAEGVGVDVCELGPDGVVRVLRSLHIKRGTGPPSVKLDGPGGF